MEKLRKKENPYLNRNAVLDPKEFYGRVEQIKKIMEAITAKTPQSCSISGLTNSGKTSILRFIEKNRDNDRYDIDWGKIGQNYKFVYIDFGYYQPKVIDEFLQVLYKNVIEPSAQAKKDANRDVSYYIKEAISDHVKTCDRKLVLLVDEFDEVLNNPEIAYDACRYMRSLLSNLQIATVISTRKRLKSIIQDKAQSQQLPSPLYNIVHFIELHTGLMKEEEAKELIQKPAEQAGVTFTDADIEFVLDISGRQVALIKIACQYLFELKQGEIDQDELETTILSQSYGVCETIYYELEPKEQELLYQIATNQPLTPREKRIALHLANRQLLKREDGTFQLFSNCMKKYIREHGIKPMIEIFPDPRSIRIGDKSQNFSPQEFELFLYLYKNAGHICTKKELKKNIWKKDVQDSTIDMAIIRLRKKIEFDPKDRISIEAIKGEGYKLELGKELE